MSLTRCTIICQTLYLIVRFSPFWNSAFGFRNEITPLLDLVKEGNVEQAKEYQRRTKGISNELDLSLLTSSWDVSDDAFLNTKQPPPNTHFHYGRSTTVQNTFSDAVLKRGNFGGNFRRKFWVLFLRSRPALHFYSPRNGKQQLPREGRTIAFSLRARGRGVQETEGFTWERCFAVTEEVKEMQVGRFFTRRYSGAERESLYSSVLT